MAFSLPSGDPPLRDTRPSDSQLPTPISYHAQHTPLTLALPPPPPSVSSVPLRGLCDLASVPLAPPNSTPSRRSSIPRARCSRALTDPSRTPSTSLTLLTFIPKK